MSGSTLRCGDDLRLLAISAVIDLDVRIGGAACVGSAQADRVERAAVWRALHLQPIELVDEEASLGEVGAWLSIAKARVEHLGSRGGAHARYRHSGRRGRRRRIFHVIGVVVRVSRAVVCPDIAPQPAHLVRVLPRHEHGGDGDALALRVGQAPRLAASEPAHNLQDGILAHVLRAVPRAVAIEPGEPPPQYRREWRGRRGRWRR